MRLISLSAILVFSLLFGACHSKKEDLSKDEITNIAKEAYIYGVPFVLEYRTMYLQAIDQSSPSYIGFGKFLHYGATTSENKDVMTPNRDTPYSWAWFDLRTEPWVLTVPPIDSTGHRYYSFQFNDLAGFVVDNVSSMEDGYDGGSYLVAPPTWKGELPKGIKRAIQGETDFMVTIARTELFGDDDLVNVKKIQEGYQIQPLSKYLGQTAPAAPPAVDFYKFVDGKTDVDNSFFDCLSFVLQFNHANPIDKSVLEKIAKIGITPGANWAKLAEENSNLAEGATAGMQAMIDTLNEIAKSPLSSSDFSSFANRSVMKDRYMDRAIGAYLGLFGNTVQHVMYANLGLDNNKEPLDGSKHKYTYTFVKGNLPQFEFFWSLTMYSMKDRFLVSNPINRYSIGSRTKTLKYGADGSLTIYLQKDNPGKDKESNWLPAPDGPFYSVLRFYGPGENILNGSFKYPEAIRVD